MTGLRYSPLHVTELCGEMQGKFIVGRARLINLRPVNREPCILYETNLAACTAKSRAGHIIWIKFSR